MKNLLIIFTFLLFGCQPQPVDRYYALLSCEGKPALKIYGYRFRESGAIEYWITRSEWVESRKGIITTRACDIEKTDELYPRGKGL